MLIERTNMFITNSAFWQKSSQTDTQGESYETAA